MADRLATIAALERDLTEARQRTSSAQASLDLRLREERRIEDALRRALTGVLMRAEMEASDG